VLFSCLNCATPRVSPLFQRAITLRVTDANGCIAEDLMTIFTEKDLQAFVPTGFTPNGDGRNDRLLVHGRAGVRVLSFRIFDRWGQLLYENSDFMVNDTDNGWDGTFRGKPAEAGTYIWSMTIQSPEEDQETQSGQTMLIR
jgi:gliding motility-associated-like protein